MYVTNTIDNLLAHGFTRRMGAEYLETLAKEMRSGLFDKDQCEWAHARGFFCGNGCLPQHHRGQ